MSGGILMLAADLLRDNPDLTASFRFLVAASAQGIALMTLNYALRIEQRYRGHRLALVGWAIESQAIAVHQGYYWIWWLMLGSNPDALAGWKEYRSVTSVSLVLMALGWILVASPYFVELSGRWWWALGLGVGFAIWALGYGFALWL